ncbi:uncharacterized protein LAESUDRAFT_321871 [Laetiporus sulphureus 93-53]|uniref:Uncharacterized protein n=1 Tax=Laetiporus sulphureus 93-53 TaxID=1314785 RepID=A0A165D1X4_9APHY|nr:uncharacterized protein LAESUDRAFT_321871 [Laetiporus sulphureus 93-53]KZT03989.1 hypothetical protein LAESUDRAFT_321871 [Laetiporus sulphureus 93-53]
MSKFFNVIADPRLQEHRSSLLSIVISGLFTLCIRSILYSSRESSSESFIDGSLRIAWRTATCHKYAMMFIASVERSLKLEVSATVCSQFLCGVLLTDCHHRNSR